MENTDRMRDRRERSTDTTDLLHAYLERGDITARDRLIQLYLPLVESFAHRFDLKRGGELAAFAVPNIVGEIKRHLRDRTTSVRMPRPIQELRVRAVRCEAELSAALQRRPTPAEVARQLGVDKEDVARALAARPRGGEQDDDASPAEGTRDAVDVSDERMTLASAFEVLDERERQIVYLRFVRDRSRSQVAEELGISERHLSRQTHAALAKLRKELERAGQEIGPRERPVSVATGQPALRPASPESTPRRALPKVSGRPPTRNEPDLPYRVSVVREHGRPEGHEWTAHAEELPGCEAHGDSVAEAVQGIEDAIEEWIEDALAKGREVPDPKTAASYSGRLMLRMPRSLHAELAGAAEREEVSLNQFIASSLERGLASSVVATDEVSEDHAGDRQTVSALLRLAIVINLIVV